MSAAGDNKEHEQNYSTVRTIFVDLSVHARTKRKAHPTAARKPPKKRVKRYEAVPKRRPHRALSNVRGFWFHRGASG